MATTELPELSAIVQRLRADFPARLLALRRLLRQWSDAEASRLALWTPVAIGAGAVLYFALTSEPPPWIAPVLVAATAAAWLRLKQRRQLIAAALFISIGFGAADWRAARVDAPIIAHELTPRAITGRLVSVDEAPDRRRLIIAIEAIEGVAAVDLPERARISWRGKGFDVLPGDRIALRAALSPPPPPEVPGGFDLARQLYFERIGAVGFAVTPPAKVGERTKSAADRASAYIEKTRLAVTRRILEAAPGQGGAMVAASVTGHRGAISAKTEAALRDSGLAHLVAISGLNMALATGLIFFTLRGALAMIEPVALRFPIKKWAAIAALLSGFCYLLLSGGEWSALRAFIMTAIVFIAILFDRRAISLRNVAIAATLILLATPEAVMHPGFQMSFAAVTALVAAYEWGSSRADPNRSFSLLARVRRYVVGIAVTDMIAAGATAPFGIYHFNQAANYGLPANIVAIPIMAFAVMPMAVAALFLMPFGLDGWAWRAAAAGVDAILVVGSAIADLPGAVTTFAQWPPVALGLLTLGGLWFCLQSAPWRVAGLSAAPAAAIFILAEPAPVLFVSRDGDNAAVIAEADGKPALAMFNPHKDKFGATVWKEHAGLNPAASPTLAMEEAGRCDPMGCVVPVKKTKVAFSADPLALAEDCRRADLVVALYPAPWRVVRSCAAVLIDRGDAWDGGAQAVWIAGGQVRVKTVGAARGTRPWTGAASSGALSPRSADDRSRSPVPATPSPEGREK